MSDSKLFVSDIFERIQRLGEVQSDDFTTLVDILGMSPQTDFVNADLAGLSLTKQTLEGCDFTGTDFSGTDFSRSRLKNCDLSGAVLTEAHIDYAVLTGCRFNNADMSGAVFEGAVLQYCDFRGANLAGAFFPKSSLNECDFSGATMTGIRFQKATLANVNFGAQQMPDGAFEDCAINASPGKKAEKPQIPNPTRNALIEKKYRSGATMAAIAEEYGISASRVRSIIRTQENNRKKLQREIDAPLRRPR